MSNNYKTIKIKRGLKTDLPALSVGEFGYCTDTKELFIGTADGNYLINPVNSATTVQTSSDPKPETPNPGDKVYETDTGASYIYDGSSWELMADDDWANVALNWGNITDKPTTFPPSAHNHTKSEISDFAHTHVEEDITDLDKYTQGEVNALLAGKVDLDDLETTLTLYGTDTTEVVGPDTYFQAVTSIDDARYDDTQVVITTPLITSTDSGNPTIVGRLIADAGIVDELVQGKTISTVGQVRKASGNQNENPRLRFKIYNSNDLTTAIAESGYTDEITSEDFFNVFESEIILQTTAFAPTDRLVMIWEAYTTAGAPTVEIIFGGTDPVRTIIPKTFDATIDAEGVIYDNTDSGLSATNAQDAIDELKSDIPTNNNELTNGAGYITDYTVTETDVTTHQAALSISESQISDLQNYLTEETVTSLDLTANVLTFTDEDGNNTTIDLSLYLDDSNLARIISGEYVAGDNVLRFTRDDNSTFDVDASMFFDDTNLVTSVAGRTGAVTLSESDISGLDKYTQNEVDTLLNGKADLDHTHDDRYYTENEVDSLLNDKANTTHTHEPSEVGLGNVDNFATASQAEAEAGTASDKFMTPERTLQAIDANVIPVESVLSTETIFSNFDLISASYENISFDVSSQEGVPEGVIFNNDGSKMYIIGPSSKRIYQYTLSTPFNVGTASYDNISVSLPLENFLRGLTFKNDGSKMYAVGPEGSVYQFTLTIPFDITTFIYDNISFSVVSQDDLPVEITFNNDGSKMYMAGLRNNTVYQYTLSTPFALNTASYDNISFSVSSQENNLQAIALNNDGSKMYIAGRGSDSVFQYTLSTPFDLSTTSYDNISFDFGSELGGITGLTFNNDGSKMYIVGVFTDRVFQYTTVGKQIIKNWNDTIDQSNLSFSIQPKSAYETLTPEDNTLYFEDNFVGIKATQAEAEAGTDDVSLMTPLKTKQAIDALAPEAPVTSVNGETGDVTITPGIEGVTASSGLTGGGTSGTVTVSHADTSSQASQTNTDGSVIQSVEVDTFGHVTNLSTIDLDVRYVTSAGFPVQEPTVTETFISHKEYRFTITNPNDFTILVKYELDNPDPTANEITLEANETSSEISITDLSLTTAYTLYVKGLVTAEYFRTLFKSPQIISKSFSTIDFQLLFYDNIRSPNLFDQDFAPDAVTFNNDGSKMHVSGSINDKVHQYTLSTPFNVGTASYDNISFSVRPQDGYPVAHIFNNDGSKMYIVGLNAESVFQYTLSTPFDLTTASYDNVSFSTTSQIDVPIGLRFNNDGSKMYILENRSPRGFYQYTLSTPFDLSTASYDNISFTVGSQDTQPRDIVFNKAGTKMYMVGFSEDSVFQYTLSTPFDLSTASYDNISFDISSKETNPSGLALNNDDSKMYIVGWSSDRVYQYTLTEY